MDYVSGGRLGIVCDLYDKMGMEVPFFGHPAPSTPIPAMIAWWFGTRIWMSRCVRVDNACKFRIEVKELWVPRTANKSDDMKVIMARPARPVRGVGARVSRAMDVVEPALELSVNLRAPVRHFGSATRIGSH